MIGGGQRCQHLGEAAEEQRCCDCGLVGCPDCVVLTAAVPLERIDEAQQSGALNAKGVVWQFRCKECIRSLDQALRDQAKDDEPRK
jgi:hypothetical protein